MLLKKQLNQAFTTNRENGFSLIEVAIALLVISIVMAGMLHLHRVYALVKQENDTKNRLYIVQSALTKYVENYGYYPRPANRNIKIGDSGFGVEAAIPTILCTVNSSVSCLATGGTVYIGDIPFAALGLPYRMTVDSYGSKLTYAVSAALTVPGGYSDTAGAIDVVVNDGSQQYTGGAPKAHFFVFSSGPDRMGGYSLSGVSITPCGTAATNGTDFENCNGDSIFRSNYETDTSKNEYGRYIRYFADGLNNFDDLTAYQNSTSSGLWSLTPNAGNLINTNSGDNILVGTMSTLPASSCTISNMIGCIVPPQTRLEVKGSISGTQLLTKRICKSGINCSAPTLPIESGMLTPSIIAGEPNTAGAYNSTTLGNAGGGILCPSRSGLTGFYPGVTGYLDEICAQTPKISNPIDLSATDCNAGEYAKEINTLGKIVCGP